MNNKYKTLVEEQRAKLRSEPPFAKYTEDVSLLLPEDIRYRWGMAPDNLKPSHPRLMLTNDTIPGIRAALEDDTPTNRLFREYLADECDGILPPAPEYDGSITQKDSYMIMLERLKKSAHNFDAKIIEICAVKALGYKLYDNEEYAYQAIYSLKNFLCTMDCKSFPFDQYRAFGYIMFIAACVYDWCYELLTEEDKEFLISAVEAQCAAGENAKGVRFEIGFPPHRQGSVSGHGSEYQLLRDHLAFSIAIYDENPSWWRYTGARFYNDYVQSRNTYYKSGISQQGTGYSPFRFTSDTFSAWIIKTATDVDPYIGIARAARAFFGFEYAPGYIYPDGDGPNIQTMSKLRDLSLIAGYLYDDAGLVAQGENLLGNNAVKEAMQGLHLTSYVIFRGKGTKPSRNRHDGMDLIQYNGSPLGQYITRERWDDADIASTFMRIRERSTANHEHRDAGHFQIYYKGMLSNDGGVYDYYGNEHWKYVHTASIAHNCPIIYNPAHRKDNKWHSGAQRYYIKESSNIQHWLTCKDYDTGTLTGHESAYRDMEKKQPFYAYLAGDIAKAYEEDTASYVGRRMLTVYTKNPDFPMAFFVYDDIESVDPSFRKGFVLQIASPNPPKISKGRIITENGGGRLVMTSLSNDVRIKGVGGRVYDEDGNYVSAKSKNYLVGGKQCETVNKKDDGHWGRVEICNATERKSAEFLNVIYVTDKDSKKVAPKVSRVDAEGITGATFGRTAVLFATSRERRACEINATVVAPRGNIEYFISGVVGGMWSVTVDGKDYGKHIASENGGLLTFTAPAGEIKITPAK